mgnify:FL=1
MTSTIINYLIWLVFTLLTTIITTILIPLLSKWIISKTQNEQLKAVIADITETVRTSVNYLERTSVAKYKSDGNWDIKSQREVLNIAVNEVMNNLLDTTKKTIKDNNINIYDLIVRHIESYIRSNKKPEV